MRTLFSKLKLKDILTLIVLLIIVFCWIISDQFFFSLVYQRFIALFLILLFLFYLQFLINKPKQVLYYCNTLALIFIVIAVLLSLIIHLGIHNDFSYKLILIWLLAGCIPYLAGLIYVKSKKSDTGIH
jgi:hypothetical protein